jgi:signal transduction histidine kinase
MARFIARRGGPRQAARTVQPPRVGHFFFGIPQQKLYCLNETARQFVSAGIPILPQDLQHQPLLTLDGQAVSPQDLPLTRAWREAAAQEAVFLLDRPDTSVQVLAWHASPLARPDRTLLGVLGTLTMPSLEPDWEGLAGLAHDLRTPLQALRNLIPVLQTSPLPGPAAEALERLRSAADRAQVLGQHLLAWCKAPTSSVLRAARDWHPLGPLLEKLAAEQSATAGRKGLRLLADLQALARLEVNTDAVRLLRLLANLLVNAIRYTTAGEVRLRASRRNGDLVLSVEDTGAGLDSEDPESIFQPYQRGRAGQSDSDSGGSGLGLAIVDRLISELEFTLEVYSEHGQGSRFDVIVPAASVREPLAGPHKQTGGERSVSPPAVPPARPDRAG